MSTQITALPEAGRWVITEGSRCLFSNEAPSLWAGVVFDRQNQVHEIWAYGRIVKRLSTQMLAAAIVPLARSTSAAALEEDEELRSLKCAVIALPGMEDVGVYAWTKWPETGTRICFVDLPRGDFCGTRTFPPLPLPTREVELQRAVVAGWTFQVARVDVERTVYYTKAEPITSHEART